MKMTSPQLKATFNFLSPGRQRRFGKLMLLLMIFIIQAGTSSYTPAFNESEFPSTTINARDGFTPPEWVLYATVNNVDFYYQISDCKGIKVVFLKFNNRNAQRVKVSWKEEFNTQYEHRTPGIKGKKQLLLSTGETFQDDCANVRVKELVVLPSEVNPTYVAEIKKFDFKNIMVVNQ